MTLKIWTDAKRQSLVLEVITTRVKILMQTLASCVASGDISLCVLVLSHITNEDDSYIILDVCLDDILQTVIEYGCPIAKTLSNQIISKFSSWNWS